MSFALCTNATDHPERMHGFWLTKMSGDDQPPLKARC